MYDCIIAPFIQMLDAVGGMKNMRGTCERVNGGKNCAPARAREGRCADQPKLLAHCRVATDSEDTWISLRLFLC